MGTNERNQRMMQMQCITTKWLPPTEKLPQRIKAFCRAGKLTMSIHDNRIDHLTSNYTKEYMVAWHLAKSLDWLEKSELFSGIDSKGNGQHVLVEKNWLHEDLK